jgi:RHS repeat-associated protein
MLRARGTQTITYTQQFSVNSKLEVITGTNGITQSVTTFTYDGDGNRVKKVEDGVGTYYVGGIYEWQATKQTSYYYVAGQRIAMRVTVGVSTTLTYLHGDHLGSTSLSTDADGDELYRRGYYPYGEERYAVGVAVTDYGFTGQREEAYIDLIEMGARWYDSSLGRWLSADTIVPDPGNPQSLNRYAYVRNNPLRYVDPSGHIEEDQYEDAIEIINDLRDNYDVDIDIDFGWHYTYSGGSRLGWVRGTWQLR